MKNLPHILAVVLILLFVINKSFAQFSIPTKTDAHEIHNRILAVELFDISSKKLDRLKRKGLLDSEKYLNEIKRYNTFIQENLEKYWKLNDQIVFLSSSEIDEIMKKGNKKYVVLLSGKRKQARTKGRYIYIHDSYTFFLYFPENSNGWDNLGYVDQVNTQDFNGFDKNKYLFKVSYPSFNLDENNLELMSDICFQYFEIAKDKGKKAKIWTNVWVIPKMDSKIETFETDTLLLLKSTIQFNLDSIPLIYKHPYKLVDFEEHEFIVGQHKPGYVYMAEVWDDYLKYYSYFLFKTENNELVEKFAKSSYDYNSMSHNAEFYSTPLSVIHSRKELIITMEQLSVFNDAIEKNNLKRDCKQKKDVVFQ